MKPRRGGGRYFSDLATETVAGIFIVIILGLLLFLPLFIGQNPWR